MHNAVEGQPIVFHLARSPWQMKDILLSDQLPGGLPAGLQTTARRTPDLFCATPPLILRPASR